MHRRNLDDDEEIDSDAIRHKYCNANWTTMNFFSILEDALVRGSVSGAYAITEFLSES